MDSKEQLNHSESWKRSPSDFGPNFRGRPGWCPRPLRWPSSSWRPRGWSWWPPATLTWTWIRKNCLETLTTIWIRNTCPAIERPRSSTHWCGHGTWTRSASCRKASPETWTNSSSDCCSPLSRKWLLSTLKGIVSVLWFYLCTSGKTSGSPSLLLHPLRTHPGGRTRRESDGCCDFRRNSGSVRRSDPGSGSSASGVTEMGAPLPLPANCAADTPWLLDVY